MKKTKNEYVENVEIVRKTMRTICKKVTHSNKNSFAMLELAQWFKYFNVISATFSQDIRRHFNLSGAPRYDPNTKTYSNMSLEQMKLIVALNSY